MSLPRWDRMLTLGVFRPLAGAGLCGAKKALPILMYHAISDDSEDETAPYYRTHTRPEVFESQMRWLAKENYRSINLDEAVAALGQVGATGEKQVLITFDDGFRDFYDQAFPILQRHGHTATMFLPTAFIGETRKQFKGRDCLTWAEVRELRAQGMRFGSHTVNHPVLYQLAWKEIEAELALSKQQLEQELNEEVSGFAYPYAFPQEDRAYTGRLAEILRGQGYRSCVTTVAGRAQPGDDLFRLKRLPVNSCDDQDLLAAKVAGHYDWFAVPQICVRRAKSWMRGRRAGTRHN